MRWNFIVKEINTIETQLDKFISTLDAKKSKTELTSLLTATTLKMNSFALAFVKDEIKIKGKWKERKLVVNVF